MRRFRCGCGQQLGKTDGFARGLGSGGRRGRGTRWNQGEQGTQDNQGQRGYGRRWSQGRGRYQCNGNGWGRGNGRRAAQ